MICLPSPHYRYRGGGSTLALVRHYSYLCAGLENGLELWNGLWNYKKIQAFFHSDTQLYCVAICLLTYS